MESEQMARIEISRIIDQLERGYRGDAWHGTPLRVILAEVNASTAARRVVPGVHTIWELTAHVTTWLTVARRRASGEDFEPSGDEDWPPVTEHSPGAWVATLVDLDRVFERLLDTMRSLTDADLEKRVPGQSYTNYVLLHGVLQHTLYHAGQIALLARAARSQA
jgi:uncharacterized damage-inducible protein DinB